MTGIPGDLLVSIIFDDAAAVERQLAGISDHSQVLSACLRVALANGRQDIAAHIRQMAERGADGDGPPVAAIRRDNSGPTISIILANYNHANYLRTSLEGMISQTVSADEIVVVEDGSTDNSIEVLQDF